MDPALLESKKKNLESWRIYLDEIKKEFESNKVAFNIKKAELDKTKIQLIDESDQFQRQKTEFQNLDSQCKDLEMEICKNNKDPDFFKQQKEEA